MIVCPNPFSPRPAFLFEKQNYVKYRKPGLHPKKVPAFLRRWRPKTRPRATARAAPVCCGASATTGTVGRRRSQAPVPPAWTSTAAGSTRRTTATVRTVFRCVASRNRERTLGTRRLVLTRPSSSAPNFLCRVGRRGRTPKSTDEPKRSRVNYFGSRSAVVTFWPVGRWNRRSPNSGRQPITCSVTERFTVSKTYSFSVFFVKA